MEMGNQRGLDLITYCFPSLIMNIKYSQDMYMIVIINLQIMINVYGVDHDPDVWDDPYEFNPERFLDPDGKLLPPDHINRKR